MIFRTLIYRLGDSSINIVKNVGSFFIIFGEAVFNIFRKPFRWHLYTEQMLFIGNRSISICLLTGIFTGMVLALQMFVVLKKFSAESVIGGIVALSMAKELGPVLTALMVNSRAGSAIAAQIGSMRVTEQIDALRSMAVNPVQYLISPRIFSGMVMLPFLTILVDFVGVVGGYLISVILLGLDGGLYTGKVVDLMDVSDIIGGLIKATVFGIIITSVGCFFGYNTTGGAKGVGNATTGAVVTAAVSVLAADYLITSFLIFLGL